MKRYDGYPLTACLYVDLFRGLNIDLYSRLHQALHENFYNNLPRNIRSNLFLTAYTYSGPRKQKTAKN